MSSDIRLKLTFDYSKDTKFVIPDSTVVGNHIVHCSYGPIWSISGSGGVLLVKGDPPNVILMPGQMPREMPFRRNGAPITPGMGRHALATNSVILRPSILRAGGWGWSIANTAFPIESTQNTKHKQDGYFKAPRILK